MQRNPRDAGTDDIGVIDDHEFQGQLPSQAAK
jgi:hypothetical protein